MLSGFDLQANTSPYSRHSRCLKHCHRISLPTCITDYIMTPGPPRQAVFAFDTPFGHLRLFCKRLSCWSSPHLQNYQAREEQGVSGKEADAQAAALVASISPTPAAGLSEEPSPTVYKHSQLPAPLQLKSPPIVQKLILPLCLWS